MRLALVTWCLIVSVCNQALGQEQEGQFKFFPSPNLKFDFDRDVPFKQADFGEHFLRQLVGDRDQQKQQLARITVSKADERKIGENQFRLFARNLHSQRIELTDKGKDVAYLRQLIDKLRPLMTNRNRYTSISVYVADSPLTDARSFPGGKIVVYRGLLKFAANEAALVGILGHELSHLDRQHQLEQFKNSLLAQRTLTGDVQDYRQFAGFSQIMMKSLMAPYALDQEKEADLDGCQWAFQAGYDPRELAEVFRRMNDRDQNRQNPVPGFLRSHPNHIDRFKAIRDASRKLIKTAPKKQLISGRENLRRREAHQ
jgi:predicted Zn-dependent protease